ncbi:TonB-dependent receptor [Pedobacter psychrodurus]|uniref:TonB-dependent receptor n=1 Tax=Pedobacter psychrodurus TaxID=2530456 RepID=A0A4R0PZD0_9SPHI|nr:TonB-dependent receptor [Pedobacter psychrodurus]TCD28610.1 TonB-dependent receptor [Pedobacter psychrodurus]
MKNKLIKIFFALFFFSVQVFAQQKLISGKVTSADDGNPNPGVSVRIKGAVGGTVTDANGSYSIKAESGQVLLFSFIGSLDQQVTVGTSSVINVKMVADTKSLNEVVVVGYGTQKKANLTGAVTTVDTKALQSRPITDVGRGLQGVVPGLTITTATGDIGGDPKIRLRGLRGSINTGAGGAAPLILVDNAEIPSLQLINPDDIESISVLKDAASASIYGTRAAFGVILITTKSGKRNGTNTITYSNNLAWATPLNTPKMSLASENSQATLLALQRFNPSAVSFKVIGYTVDAPAIEKMREWERNYLGQDLGNEMVQGRDFDITGGNLYFYRTWDPAKLYLKEWTPQQTHNLSLSGGSEKINYNLGAGYLGQSGVLKVNPDGFDRYNFTLGVNASPKPWVDVRGKIIFSNTKTTSPFSFSGSQYGPYYYLYRWPSSYPYGTFNGLPFRGTITEVEQAKMDENRSSTARIQLGSTFKLAKGLNLDADYFYTSTEAHLHQTGGNTSAYDFWSFNGTNLNYTAYQNASFNKVSYNSAWTRINTGKVYATYNKEINEHSFKGILGGDIEYNESTSNYSEKRNLLDPDYGEIPLASGDQFANGAHNHFATLGYFARINYAYKNKYLLEVNGRYDGSSRFPSNDLYAFFPSVSAGYLLSEESFMKNSKTWLSFLKVRASYGSVGNQIVGSPGSYAFLATMSSSNSGWLLPGGSAITVGTPGFVSPSLTWEKVSTADLGIDARFLNNDLGITFDVFRRTTSGMLTSGATLPASFGTGAPRVNFGELQGTGWELAVDYNHHFSSGLHISFSGTLSDATEKLSKFANATRSLPGPISEISSSYYEGMKLGEIWGYETDRLFTESDFSGRDAAGRYIYAPGVASQAQLESGSFYFGPGDIKYKDLNGDGVIYSGTNTVDDPGDKKVIGNSTPRYLYGIRLGGDWKGFDVNVFFQGVAKRDLWASGPTVFPGFRGAEGWYSNQMDYWTPQNPDAFYPRPTDYGASVDRWNFQPQTRYLLNMAYLRLKNLSVGYSLPKNIIKRIKMEKIRIYFSGENLLTFDHLGDIPVDPETDFSQSQLNNDRAGFGRVYPYRKTYSLGLQATF